MQDRRAGELTEVPNMNATHWQRIDVGPEWVAQFRDFQRSAFRLEVLQAYGEPSESEALATFKAGGTVDRAYIADWCDIVAAHRDSGHTMNRVHLVDLPLSDYMRFEVEAAYVHTSAAGETILLLDRAKVDQRLEAFLTQDFWFFDDQRVMVQIYNDAGTLQHSLLTSDPDTVAYYREVARRVTSLGEHFIAFYQQATGKQLPQS